MKVSKCLGWDTPSHYFLIFRVCKFTVPKRLIHNGWSNCKWLALMSLWLFDSPYHINLLSSCPTIHHHSIVTLLFVIVKLSWLSLNDNGRSFLFPPISFSANREPVRETEHATIDTDELLPVCYPSVGLADSEHSLAAIVATTPFYSSPRGLYHIFAVVVAAAAAAAESLCQVPKTVLLSSRLRMPGTKVSGRYIPTRWHRPLFTAFHGRPSRVFAFGNRRRCRFSRLWPIISSWVHFMWSDLASLGLLVEANCDREKVVLSSGY